MPTRDLFDTFRSTRQFRSLDGLRALSILMVIWHHSGGSLLTGALGKMFLGVDVFFVVSGFLIVTLLLREQEKTGSISFRNFYVRRFLRIFPLYYAVLAMCFVISRISHGHNAIGMRHDLPYAALYISNWVPMRSLLDVTWSLSAEEQFYLVWPLIMFLLVGLRSVYALVALIVVSIGLQLWHVYGGVDMPSMFYLHTFLPILLGVSLAYLLHYRRTFGVAAGLLGHRYSALLALMMFVGLLFWPVEDITGIPQITMQLSMAVLVGACVIREDNALAPLLSARPMARIGMLSYAMYLFHLPIATFTTKLVPPQASVGWLAHDVGLWILTSAVSVAAAELSYRYFESRFLRLKDRFEPAR